jgi:hypothetical protein
MCGGKAASQLADTKVHNSPNGYSNPLIHPPSTGIEVPVM